MPTITATCIAPGCDRTDIRARKMCGMHYQRWAAGNPMSYEVPDPRDQPAPDWCVCEHPDQQPINLFGWIHVTDVTECARCHRPPLRGAT